jgi:16S rRNA (guanine527-N7)-methyltransferase
MAGAAAMKVALGDEVADRLVEYLALLHKWNAAYNLTAVRDPEQMVVRLVLDSLSIVPSVQGVRVLDIGSGAGLPGVPLALARPELAVTLLDSNRKKTRFLLQAAGELGLAMVSVAAQRVEDHVPTQLYDCVMSRAFSSLAEFATLAARLCRPGGLLLAMKGRYPGDEIAAIPAGWEFAGSEELHVPGLDAQRYLIRLIRQPHD